jgi:hypothetical protein
VEENNYLYLIIGVVIAIISLIIFNSLPPYIVTFSLLSPTGPQIYILGVRIKHWFVGLILLVIGYVIREDYRIGYFLMGFGAILFLDELPELLNIFYLLVIRL